MAPDIRTNFFTGTAAKPEPEKSSRLLQIMFVNDVKFRADFGQWLYENFDELAREYKKSGRFLTLKEIQDSPLSEF